MTSTSNIVRLVSVIAAAGLFVPSWAQTAGAPSENGRGLCKNSAGTEFCVPTEYLPWGTDGNDEAFLIKARYPGLAASEGANDKHQAEKTATVLIYFDNQKNHQQSENAIALRLQSNPVTEAIDSSGLRQTRRAANNITTEVFYAPETDPNSAQPEWIRCNDRQSGAAYVQAYECVMHFRHLDHYFDVRMGRDLVPSWKRIKGEAIALVTSFTTQ